MYLSLNCVLKCINIICIQYANIQDAIGSYSYFDEDGKNPMSPLFCMVHFKEGTSFGFNESYTFDGEIVQGIQNINFRINVICRYLIKSNLLFRMPKYHYNQ